MPPDDDSLDGVTEPNRHFPSAEEIEEVVTRALRRYGYGPTEPLSTGDDVADGSSAPTDTPDSGPTDDELIEALEGALRRGGFIPLPALEGQPHPLAPAGLKLKVIRERSGWTVSEVAERTGVPLDMLTAFEAGDSAAAGKLGRADLERLASTCCGSLADLLGTEHPWARSRPAFPFLGGSGPSIDPTG